jgi:hypothetical protein
MGRWCLRGKALSVGSLLDPLGLFDGGGSSSASVSSSVNVTIAGLDKIGVTETVELKPIEIKPLSLTETIDLKPVEIKPLSLTETIDLKPVEIKPLTVTMNDNIDLQPINLNESIDLKPVAIDTCQTLRLAPLPETRVSNPYHHRVGYSLFGVEVFGVTYNGESEQNVESPRRAQVVERWGHVEHHRPSSPMVLEGDRGIRVRVLHPDDE